MELTDSGQRPKLRLPLTKGDWITEFIGFVFLVFLFILPLRYIPDLPARIPAHFDVAGAPDGYGGKNTLWILPAIGFFLWLLMTVLSRFPHIFNYSVNITAGNAETQYRLATGMMRILKTVILVMFSFISYKTIRTATGNAAGLGRVFLPVMITVTFTVVIVYIVRSLRAKNQD